MLVVMTNFSESTIKGDSTREAVRGRKAWVALSPAWQAVLAGEASPTPSKCEIAVEDLKRRGRACVTTMQIRLGLQR